MVGPQRLVALANLVGGDQHRTLVAARSLSHRLELDRLAQWFSYLDRHTLEDLLPGLGWTDAAWEKTQCAQAEALARFGF